MRVVFTSNALTIGGSERGLVESALALDRARFEVSVVGVHELGPRAKRLEEGGVEVRCADGAPPRLAGLLRGADVVHAFRPGAADPLVPRAAAEAGVGALVETNVFGLVDPSEQARGFDCRLFISKSSACSYRRRAGLGGAGFHDRHRVLPLAMDGRRLRELAPSRRDAKQRIGLDPDRPVVGRVGRADDLKWRNVLVDMVPRLAELAPDAQLLFVGVTPAKRERLGRVGVLERCLLHEPVADDEHLAALYAACDVFVSAAELGESQGLAICEALVLGVPVVTCSTPWVDNAQAELVDHGESGYLASHPRPFAEAVAALLGDEDLRARFGAAGRARIEPLLDPAAIASRLERLYESLAAGGGPPEEWEPSPAEVDAYAAAEPERAAAEFRPLTRREWLEARGERERERAVRLRGLLRRDRLPLAGAMARARIEGLRRRLRGARPSGG